MTDKDLQDLKNYEDLQKQLVSDLVKNLTQIKGYSIDGGYFSLGVNHNGPYLKYIGPISESDIDKLPTPPNGSKWEQVKRYVMGAEKTGLLTKVNGKEVFIPMESTIDNTKPMDNIYTPQDFARFMIAAHPQLDGKINVLANGSLECKMQPQEINELMVGAWYFDKNGHVYNSNMIDRKFSVKFIDNPWDAKYQSKGVETVSSYGEEYDIVQKASAMHHDDHLYDEDKVYDTSLEWVRLQDVIDDASLVFNKLANSDRLYVLSCDGHSADPRPQNDRSRSIGQDVVKSSSRDHKLLGQLQIAQLIKQAACQANGISQAKSELFLVTDVMDGTYDAVISVAKAHRGGDYKSIIKYLINEMNLTSKMQLCKTFVYFLANPCVSNAFGYQMDASPEQAIEAINDYVNKNLKNQFNNMVEGFVNQDNERDDDERVMVRQPNGWS